MPRPRKFRYIRHKPNALYFKPRGIPLSELDRVQLTFDEVEALRLSDLEGLGQIASAEKMQVSQPTLHRILVSARKKIADALINGKAIKIEGGPYKLAIERKHLNEIIEGTNPRTEKGPELPKYKGSVHRASRDQKYVKEGDNDEQRI